MPEAVVFAYQNKLRTVYFAQPNAKLPMLIKREMKLITWGRRQSEAGEMPLGGWARLDAIHKGKWHHYIPKPVCLPLLKFMKTDYEGHVHWHCITKGQWIQGLLAQEENEIRLYIVTITPDLLNISYDRWPRIMIGSK